MTETCWICARPGQEPAVGQNIPLCNPHWDRWLVLFAMPDSPLPPCAAHVIRKETTDDRN